MKIKAVYQHFTLLLMVASISGFDAIAEPATADKNSDHNTMKELKVAFKTGPEVTKACLGCHKDAARQIQRTKHWTWEYLNPSSGQRLGKRYVINNFCVAAASNYAACTSCHVGYGWKDENFDFSSQENVDCLVCHDTTGEYIKPSGLAGHPAYKTMEIPPGSGHFVKPVDLRRIAQKVGKTSRDTCGTCHFYGGGGDGVKHGDMDSSLAAPGRHLDVHMDATGADFTCAKCHMTTGHEVPGSRYSPTAIDKDDSHVPGKVDNYNPGSWDNTNPGTCQACHGNEPHATEVAVLNKHGGKLSCQVCHIPAMARGGVATKMTWDWSTAGKMGQDGNPMQTMDAKGRVIYDSKKGNFTLGENVAPEYVWFNGQVKYTLLGDKVDKTSGITPINRFEGSPNDGKSVIWPVKVFRGVQPYDPVNKTLVIPHTTGVDDASYWKNFNWEKAISAGMATVGAPFSGKVDFVRTEMTWPINHMVAPKEDSLACKECHTKGGIGRMKGLQGLQLVPDHGKHRN